MKTTLFFIVIGAQSLIAMQHSEKNELSKLPLECLAQRIIEKELWLRRTFSGDMDPKLKKKYMMDAHYLVQVMKLQTRQLKQQLGVKK